MQNDSMQRTFDTKPPNESDTQDSSVSYNCNHCVLIFKTRIYLYEHLHQVHGLDIDTALRDSGLKSLPSKAKHDNSHKQSDFAFNCKSCNFKSGNWSIYNEHKHQCSGTSNNESPTTKTSITVNKYKQFTGAKEIGNEKNKQKSNSKDVKIYTKSAQTITKCVTAASAMKSDCDSEETDTKTLRLEESAIKSYGVFQVTAKSIDIAEGPCSQTYLLTDPTLAKPVDPFKDVTQKNPGKRAAKESAKSTTSKKSKLELDIVPETLNKIQSSGCSELSFEVSDDEDKHNPVCEEATKVYFCKHCEFNSSNLKHVFSHYEDNHPYLRYNSIYIEEKSDQSALFRCLECPVEFSNEAYLRKHYSDVHPEALNVFTLKSSDLNLIYKCFVCSFTSNVLQSLREHYDKKHPSHNVENPLLYCKYSSTHCHREIKISEEDKSPEKHASERTTKPCKEQQSAPSKPTTKAPDGTLYHCNKCIFNHKSVVVLHVHYKKCHPEEAITLDQIKQSICAPTDLPVEEKPVPALDHSYYVVTEESSASPISDSETMLSDSAGVDHASSSQDKKFFCNLCDFSSINVRSVISHHNAKHDTITTNIQEIVQHTAMMESKHSCNVDKSVSNIYEHTQDMYYCYVCNYGNTSLKGLLNHQIKIHEKIKISKEHVQEYTALIRGQIENSKSHPNNSILPNGLPLPLIKEANDRLFFCHFCNYRHKNKTLVIRHYLKMHKGFRITTQQLVAHTSLVYERLNMTCQSKSDGQSQKVILTNSKKRVHNKILNKSLKTVPQTHIKLVCSHCSYGSHFLNLMRKHIQNRHKKKMSYSDIVQICGTGATFQPGYYCDVCSFHSTDLEEATKHGKNRHFGRSVSRHFIITQLYLSPEVCAPKKKHNSVNNYNLDSRSDPQTSEQNDTETYSCKACSFKGTSLSGITSHYRAVHPWCVKEDGSVLDVSNSSKRLSISSKGPDRKEYVKTFDSYQVPLEFDNLTVPTEEAKYSYSCSYCPATFEEHGGLLIHLGMKHRDEVAEEMPQLELSKRIQVFKCCSCSYVNNIRQGVIAHTHMKHPAKALKADSLYIGSEHLHNVEKKVKNGMWKFCGYMCKVCSQIFSSKEKLKIHRETHRKRSMPGPCQSSNAADGSKVKYSEIWCQHCGLYCASAEELTDHLRICQKNNIYTCVLCPAVFCTKVRLGIHYTKKHGKKAFFKHYAPLYNQPSKNPSTAECTQLEQTKSSVVTASDKVLVYKCPSCRYVNSAAHGTLTHCQMRHPNIVVRADALKTAEIHLANMIGCQSATGLNHGGYRCKKCPMVYGVLTKLKKHCEADHKSGVQAMSEHLTHAKQPTPEDDSTVSASLNQKKPVNKFCHFFKCSLCSYSTLILKQLGSHYTQRHGKSAYIKFYSPLFYQANKKAKTSTEYEETEETKQSLKKAENALNTTTQPLQTKVYKCSICSYGSFHRRYLISHLRNRHKLDSQAVYKQMEKYKNYKPTAADGQFTCRKCPNVFFESRGRLLAHYRTFHYSEMKMDFTIFAERTDRTTGVYKCNHCKKKIFGIKNLSRHLDRHRAARLKMKQKVETIEGRIAEVSEQGTVQEDIKLNMKIQEILTTKTSPKVSPSTPPGPEVPVEEPSEGKHACLRCKRTFMSLKGLRSHERSHLALAAIKKMDNLSASDFKEEIEQYLVYRAGTTRPFMCKICSYRTTVMGLWKSHIIKNHQYVFSNKRSEEGIRQNFEDGPNLGDDINALDGDDEPENSYLEPPDVQRQLKHYNVIAQMDPALKTQEIHMKDPRMLPCEMCNFNSQHLSAMRRHYLRHHGKKLIRCKDCNFFTCFRKNLDLHEQIGHSTVQSEPTHQKNLCCPFCLYQSKNKNNMIDHIVLHREERVTPIEVCRSKLSRYLQGIVFRCHKCTFTSGSADNLHLHLTKHNDIKPFKCRLCYFDCTQLRDLEAHLCDKHQVVRNHQLVGQISLDQLKARDDRISQEHEDEIFYGSQNNEQIVGNLFPQNKKRTEVAIKKKQTSEQIVMFGAEFSNISKGETKLDKETEENHVQIKARADLSDSSTVCVKAESDVLYYRLLDDANDAKQKITTEDVDNQKNCSKLEGQAAVTTNQNSTKKCEIKNSVTKNIDKSALILPSSIELKLTHDKQNHRRFNIGHTHNQINYPEQTNPYGEMPILEKYFKEQHITYVRHCETSEKSSCSLENKDCSEESTDMSKNETELQKNHNPPELHFTDGSAEVPSPVDATLFACDLCGRTLANTSELERHILRHGM